MYFKGKVKCRSILWQHDTFAFGCKSHDVVVVERSCHTIHVVHLVGMVCHIFKHRLEFLQPCFHVILSSFRRTTKAIIAYHAFRRNMNFFPFALHVEQFHMKALVAVFLGRIDIVDHRAWTLLEEVGENCVYMQTDSLLVLQSFGLIDDTDIVLAVHMLEVAFLCLHLSPYTIR